MMLENHLRKKFYLQIILLISVIGSFWALPCTDSNTVHIDSNCGVQCNNTCCPDLDSALSISDLDDTCVVLSDNVWLKRKHSLQNVKNFVLSGPENTMQIYCNASISTGISFYLSENISFNFLAFNNCFNDHVVPSTSTTNEINLSSTLYFNQVNNVEAYDVVFSTTKGSSFVLFNCQGNISFRTVRIIHAQSILVEPSCSGIVISYTDQLYTSHNNITLEACAFKSINSSKNTTYCKGGGLSVFFTVNSTKNQVNISNTNFTSSTAQHGGGVSIEMGSGSFDNQFNFQNCQFSKNFANESGGGVFVYESISNKISHWLQRKPINVIVFSRCNFTENQAREYGGGFHYQYQLNTGFESRFPYYKTTTLKFLENTNFTGNQAVLGFAINSKFAPIEISNIDISNNCPLGGATSSSKGAVYLYKVELLISGKSNIISKNKNSAVVLEDTMMYIDGNVIMDSNQGVDGGALTIYGASSIVLKGNSTLLLSNNIAKSHGGALNVHVPGPAVQPLNYIVLNRYQCFFIFTTSKARVSFENNKARKLGSDIFATTLQNCRHRDKAKLIDFFLNESFSFSSKHDDRYIATLPLHLSIGEKIDWEKAPGILFEYCPKLTDELEKSVGGVLDIFIVSNTSAAVKIKGDYDQFIIPSHRDDKKNCIHFIYSGKPYSSFELLFISPGTAVIPKQEVKLQLIACPYGYELNGESCVCKNPDNTIAQCLNNQVYVIRNVWVSKSQNDHAICPVNYCRQCTLDETITGGECPFDMNEQCLHTRKSYSRLCSECAESTYLLSVLLRPGKCTDCSGTLNYIYFTIAHLACVIIMNVLLVIVNYNSYASYVNAVVFSYQLLDLLIPTNLCSTWNKEPAECWVITLVGMLGGSYNYPWMEHCFYDGMNDLTRYWVSFATPFSWLIGFILVRMAFKLLKRFDWIECSSDVFYRVFNTIFLIACCSTLKFSFAVLDRVKIDGTCYVYVYAKEEYFGKTHLPLFLVAIILLFFITLICVFIGWSATKRKKTNILDLWSCYSLSQWLQRPFETGYKTTKRQSIFSLFYVVCSVITMAMAIFIHETWKITWINFVLVLFCFTFMMVSPFQERYMTHYNTLMQINTILVLACIDADLYVGNQSNKNFLFILLMIPILILLLRLTYHCYTTFWPHLPNFSRIMEPEFLDVPKRFLLDETDHPIPEN